MPWKKGLFGGYSFTPDQLMFWMRYCEEEYKKARFKSKKASFNIYISILAAYYVEMVRNPELYIQLSPDVRQHDWLFLDRDIPDVLRRLAPLELILNGRTENSHLAAFEVFDTLLQYYPKIDRFQLAQALPQASASVIRAMREYAT